MYSTFLLRWSFFADAADGAAASVSATSAGMKIIVKCYFDFSWHFSVIDCSFSE
jgi:hypothetical protein